MSRLLLTFAASSIALITNACVAPESKQCGADGPICPAGWVCIEDLSACIDPKVGLCGNGVTDTGEQCDDGNLENHDTCNWDCKLPRCGDRLVNTYEVDGTSFTETCDDGVNEDTGETRSGDGCNATCTSIEVCGDGIKNDYLHLARDESGNLTSVTVPAEECDELGVDTTACNKDCTIARCGDGKINPVRNEECDPNTGTSQTDNAIAVNHSQECNIDCTVASCGDGQTNPVRLEQCDLGSFCANGAECETAADCPAGLPDNLCIPRDVECCTAGCQDARCGDRVTQDQACGDLPAEVCDDGKYCDNGARCLVDGDCPGAGANRCRTRDNAACSFDCKSVGACGDGYINDYPPFNELCDDGKHCADLTTVCTSDAACASQAGEDKTCRKRNTAACDQNCKSTGVCGDGIVNDYAPYNEICDDGRRCSDGTACSDDNPCANGACIKREGFGCNIECTSLEVCGDKIVNDYDHPMISLGRWRGRVAIVESLKTTVYDIEPNTAVVDSEACDDGKHCSDGTECLEDLDCAEIVGGDGLCKPRNGDGCSQDCLSVERCGDGYLSDYDGVDANEVPRVAELCDDGGNENDDGCNASCSSSGVCGNSILDPGEECDYGLSFNGIGAPPPPESAFCLPGAVGGQQACRFPCSAQCGLNQCGNGRKDAGEDCDDGSQCVGTNNPCEEDSDCPGTAVGRCKQDNEDNCTNTCRFNTCGDNTRNLLGGTTRIPTAQLPAPSMPLQVCDTGGVNTATCNFNCTTPVCGDKDSTNAPIVNFPVGETCDNGPGLVNGQTMESNLCNTNCRIAFCGDSITNATRREVCDDGNNADGDGCAGNCLSPETCGDGVTNNYPHVDFEGFEQPPEVCDNGRNCTNLGKACTGDADCGGIVGACVLEQCTNIGKACMSDLDCDGLPGACETRSGDKCSDDCLSNEVCGDSYLNDVSPWNESCDDGNDRPDDGCDGSCFVETGWACPELGEPCSEVCGDGFVVGDERCDDGGECEDGTPCETDSECLGVGAGLCEPVAGDGCTTSCTIEDGWACEVTGIDGGPCAPICGDLKMWGDEQCDDGNLTNDDGCNDQCDREAGWTCPGTTGGASGRCATVCGDNLVRGFEQCDDGDGNVPAEDDGCDLNCRFELGWDCPARGEATEGQNCSPVCGDFVIRGSEQCDDGLQCANGVACTTNANCQATPGDDKTCAVRAGDGCSVTCQREPGWSCPAGMAFIGGECLAVCGDNLTRGAEECDNGKECADGTACTADANCASVSGADKTCRPRPADGCDAACQVEAGWSCVVTGGVTTSCTPGCGDGLILGAETCDDGNDDPGDGCSASCQTESGWNCAEPNALCLPICGDGLVRANDRYTETCDDENLAILDGCDTACKVEVGWTCNASDTENPTPCDEICSDGLKVGLEECDDDSDVVGDGCSATCEIEDGFRCPDVGQLCLPICGDGLVRGNNRYNETCDNALVNFDGCNTECKVETGWTCDIITNPNAPSPCDETCGDGLKVGLEACDDFNENAGDGCSLGCEIETGWRCPDVGQLCLPICGDQLVRANDRYTEECDNAVGNFDGCDTACKVETGWTCNAIDTEVSTPCDETCGDGLKVGLEECDDFNTDAVDGCSNLCEVEDGFRCPDVGQLCLPICGDGILGQNAREAEQCDDDDLDSGDGCDSGCRIETGWTCTDVPGATSSCSPTCGDGLVRSPEVCDDGKECADGTPCSADAECVGQSGDQLCQARGADGCTSACALETGWVCPVQGGNCTAICGDGLRLGTEACDDDDNDDGDGCDSGCKIETGWSCSGTLGGLSGCTPICGDGLVRLPETCDDGKHCPDGITSCTSDAMCGGVAGSCAVRALDGCTDTCAREDGWTCPIQGGACQANCGDGDLLGIEECDDGGNANGDGCDSGCMEEPGWDCTDTDDSVCATVCGDGIIRGTETCDDGKQCTDGSLCDDTADCVGVPGGDATCAVRASDGCGLTCLVEDGWTCPNLAGNGGECVETCGDGKVRGIETCDDGDTAPLDGCSATCQEETGWDCPAVLGGAGGECAPVCNDGFVRGNETCDEGGAIPDSNGGCVSCQAQTGWTCPTTDGNGGTCVTTCGDFLLRDLETCDDGNDDPGDGCDSSCLNEGVDHWFCPGLITFIGGQCTPICGSGEIDGAETCDDDNTVAGDGCDSSCKIETGWTCPTEGALCQTVCGDGYVRGGETCDEGGKMIDGTTDVPDTNGCLSCVRQTGWSCPTVVENNIVVQRVSCDNICGDGIVIAGEETCDEGTSVPSKHPADNGLGCSSCVADDTRFHCREPGRTCVVRPVLGPDEFTVLTGSLSYDLAQATLFADDLYFQTGSLQVVTPSASCGAGITIDGSDVVYTPATPPTCTPPTGSLWQDTFTYSLAAPADGLVRTSGTVTMTINREPELEDAFTCVLAGTPTKDLNVAPLYTDIDGNVINETTIGGTASTGVANRTGTTLTFDPTDDNDPERHDITITAQDTSGAPGTATATWTAVWNDVPTIGTVEARTVARGKTTTYDFAHNGPYTNINLNGSQSGSDNTVVVTVSDEENGTFGSSATVVSGGVTTIGPCTVTGDDVVFTGDNAGIGSGSCWVRVCEPCEGDETVCSKKQIAVTTVTCQNSTDAGTDDGCQVETDKPICDTTIPSTPVCIAAAEPGDNSWYIRAGASPHTVSRDDLLANDGTSGLDYKVTTFDLTSDTTTDCGSVSINSPKTIITYTRTDTNCFSDSFMYRVETPAGAEQTAQVTITLNRAPTLNDAFQCVAASVATSASFDVSTSPIYSDPDSHALNVSSIDITSAVGSTPAPADGVNPVVFTPTDNTVGATYTVNFTASDTQPTQDLAAGIIVASTAAGSDSAVLTYRWNDAPTLTEQALSTLARTESKTFDYTHGAGITNAGTVGGVSDANDKTVAVKISATNGSFGTTTFDVLADDDTTVIGTCAVDTGTDVVTFTANTNNVGTGGSCFVQVCEPCAQASGGQVCTTQELTFDVITCKDNDLDPLDTDLGCSGTTFICDDEAPPDGVPLCVECEVDGNCGGGNPGWTCVSNVCDPPDAVSAVDDTIHFLVGTTDREYDIDDYFLGNDANYAASTFTLTSTASCGTVSLENGGAPSGWAVLYEEPLDASACLPTAYQATFTYEVCNIFVAEDCDEATVTVNLNQAPTLADSYSCAASSGTFVLSRDITPDFSDPESHAISSVSFVGSPAGTLVTGGTTVQYTRSDDTNAESVPFTIQACDDRPDPLAEGCDTATWTAVYNDAPTLNTFSTPIEVALGVNKVVTFAQILNTWGDAQVPTNPLASITVESGDCSIENTNEVHFTGTSTGPDSCVIQVCEECGSSDLCVQTTINFNVNTCLDTQGGAGQDDGCTATHPICDTTTAPVCVALLTTADTIGFGLHQTSKNYASVVFTANDVNVGTVQSVSATTGCGTSSVSVTDGLVTYEKPDDAIIDCDPDFVDMFTYNVCSVSNPATCVDVVVTVDLNQIPLVDNATTCFSSGTATLDVVDQFDSDLDGDSLGQISAATLDPDVGTIGLSGTVFTYTPSTPTTTTATFSVCDDGLDPACNESVTWAITYNDAPTANETVSRNVPVSQGDTVPLNALGTFGALNLTGTVTVADDADFLTASAHCNVDGTSVTFTAPSTPGSYVCHFKLSETCDGTVSDQGVITFTVDICFDAGAGADDPGCLTTEACDVTADPRECVACTDNGDCEGATPLCDAENTCVECIDYSNCTNPNEPYCDSNGVCLPCTNDTECTAPGLGVCDDANGTCHECLDETDCTSPTADYCSATFVCVECTLDSHCETLHDTGWTCDGTGTCVEPPP
ncbi:MAG: DUF4215 domain-containing protein [Deltaproteobacteria bacterium]|nr:DUF4215 domain-containing protein [Deltaproteobacteria bacterium]